ncbi:MAG: hypothetical protein DMF49_05870, partial [Acidobacteria bacterium]
MANLARAVVLVASATLTIVAVGPAEPQGSASNAAYFPNVLLVIQDSHTVHSYDVIKNAHVLVTFTSTNCRDVCPLETARRLSIDQAEQTSNRVVIGNDAGSHWMRHTAFDGRGTRRRSGGEALLDQPPRGVGERPGAATTIARVGIVGGAGHHAAHDALRDGAQAEHGEGDVEVPL